MFDWTEALQGVLLAFGVLAGVVALIGLVAIGAGLVGRVQERWGWAAAYATTLALIVILFGLVAGFVGLDAE